MDEVQHLPGQQPILCDLCGAPSLDLVETAWRALPRVLEEYLTRQGVRRTPLWTCRETKGCIGRTLMRERFPTRRFYG